MGSEHSDCRWQSEIPVRVTAPHRIFLTPFWVAGLFATRTHYGTAQAQKTLKSVKQNRLRMGSEHSDCRWQPECQFASANLA